MIASAGGGIATAASVTIPDHSFEISTNIPGGYVAGSGTNWLSTGNGSRRIQNFNTDMFSGTDMLPAPAEGTNCLVTILNGVPGFCWQKVGTVQSNTLYTLNIAVGQSLIDAGGVGKIALVNSASPFGAVLAETPVDTSTVTPGSFADFTVTYTAGYQAGGDLTILMQGDSGTQLIFDNVRLEAAPLPLTPTAALPLLSTPSGTIYRGTVVTLSELPAGAAPFYYRWQSDNGTGGATFTDIAGASAPTCAVNTTGFTVGTPVQYRVVVTNDLGAATSPVVTLTAIEGLPVITRETLPVSAYDVEGGEVTFTAVVDGSRPLALQWVFDNGAGAAYIPNATNASLTIKNLQLSDAGSYSLQASNQFGTVNSAVSFLTVDPRPTDNNGVIISKASQTGLGSTNTFAPTWTLATNSLIQGKSPSESVGSFTLERAGGTPVLTDGKFGILPPAGNASVEVATCGRASSGAGSSIVYKLPAAANGYDLTNIVIYGGWSDAGRDQQQYNVFYSTVAAPTNYDNMIAYVYFQPTNDLAAQCATRVSLTGTNGVVAKNVAAIKLDFNVLVADTENGYTGYAEFQAFGHPSAPAPVLSMDTQPATGSDVVGSKMTFVAGFTSDTPMTLQWRVDKGSGPVAIPGATNATLTLSDLQLSDSGSYSLKASNAAGSSVSKASSFVVNLRPDPDGYGVIVSPANQTGAGATFTPTWAISTNSLIYGTMPTARGSSAGAFIQENAGGIVVLTDGQFGSVGSTINKSLATCGSGAGGKSVTYTLAGSQSGYDITNIVLYAGWSDGGRDQQAYTVYYSTVSDPNTFNPISSTEYNPTLPGAVPSADRVTFTSPTSSPMAVNVAKIMVDFTSPAGENGYSGYAEISVLGSPSATLSIAPVVLTDTLPATGSDVVGSEVTFRAAFGGATPIAYQWRKDSGNGPVDILGATSPSLTLNNLQLSDSGSYSLQASNAMGITTSTPNTFTVKSAPTPENGMLIATANQASAGEAFSPTWAPPPASLLAGAVPSSVGTGSFVTEGSGGTLVLTDGKFGTVGAGNASLASCGVGVGTTVTYTLSGSASGYDLTRIVTYGGWGDSGRDQQHYTVSYSTVADPATFITLASASYNPDIPGSMPTADRVTITSATTAPLAMNVAAVRFDFTTPTGENNWSGYSELSVFGVACTPLEPPSFGAVTVSGGNLIMAGAGGTPGSAYTVLSSTNAAAPIANWVTNSVGVFDASGACSVSLPIIPTQPASFFRLRVP